MSLDQVRLGFAQRGLNVANLTDDDLIHVAQDAVAEFGEGVEPTGVQWASILWRYQPGRARPAAKPRTPRLDFRTVLDFEDRDDGSFGKDRRIREQLGVRPGPYYLALNRAIDMPEGQHYRPALVERLLKERDRRRMLRTPSGMAS